MESTRFFDMYGEKVTRETCDATASASEIATVVVLTTSGPLLFCTHHFAKHMDQLAAHSYPAAYLADNEPIDMQSIVAAVA